MFTKCINTAARMLAGRTKQLSNSTLTFKARIYMDCYICGKEYIIWEELFYHKRKVHSCTNIHSSRYEYEVKNAAKFADEKERKCMFCPK